MKKHQRIGLTIEKNAFVDGGDGIISFPNGQVITDGSVQRNGTRYDIASMDLSEYKGQITADHTDMLQSVIGKALGLAKTAEAVTISGIKFAVQENALAQLAYDLFKGGYITDLSIETYGPWPDESDNTFYQAKLIGLSAVVVGNNRSATVNQLVRNSIEQAKQDGLDTSEVERIADEVEEPKPQPQPEPVPAPEPIPEPTPAPEPAPEVQPESTKQENDMKFVTIKNSRDFVLKLSYKNAAGDDVATELAPGATVDVSEDQKEDLEKQINGAQAPAPDMAAAIRDAVNAAMQPLQEKLAAVEQNAFDAKAKEPEFTKTANGAGQRSGVQDLKAEINAMDYREVHGEQLLLAWNWLKGGDTDAAARLRKINGINLEKLKENGVVKNSVSLGDFGNFVISRELLKDIQGVRTDYTPLIDATEWKETLSTQMAWLERSGDIDMQPVAFLDDATSSQFPNANLKPISEYTTNLKTADLEELAAVTPVMNAATRFLAADLLGDVAQGYRNDYDRKRAQLIVARLEQAVEGNGNSVIYNVPDQVSGVVDFLRLWTKIGEKTPNGTYVMGTSSFAELQTRALSAGTNGPLANIFTSGRDGVPNIFGRPYIVVSDDLLPALNTGGTKSFVVNGTTVNVNHAVFYVNLANFTGRTSGGLNYDLSMEAAYEEGGVVKSAFQRNEMLLRGSFFRGGAIKDSAQVAALAAPGVS